MPRLSGVPGTQYFNRDAIAFRTADYESYARFDSATGEGVVNAWHALGQQTATTLTMDGVARTLSYLYDAAGNRTRVTHPDAAWLGYQYDVLGRMTGLDSSGTTGLVTQTFNAYGLPATLARYSSAHDATFGYSPVGLLTSMVRERPRMAQRKRAAPSDRPSFARLAAAQLVSGVFLLERQPAETLVELGHPAAFLKLLLAAGPRGVAGRIDVELQGVAFLAPGGAGLEFGPIGHLDRNGVVVGVRIGLHGISLRSNWPVPTGAAGVGKGARLAASTRNCNP
jgi:YD repeat-containing protein